MSTYKKKHTECLQRSGQPIGHLNLIRHFSCMIVYIGILKDNVEKRRRLQDIEKLLKFSGCCLQLRVRWNDSGKFLRKPSYPDDTFSFHRRFLLTYLSSIPLDEVIEIVGQSVPLLVFL